jgi:hypothetical protein
MRVEETMARRLGGEVGKAVGVVEAIGCLLNRQAELGEEEAGNNSCK